MQSGKTKDMYLEIYGVVPALRGCYFRWRQPSMVAVVVIFFTRP